MSNFFHRLFSNKPLLTKIILSAVALLFVGACLLVYFLVVVPPANSDLKEITLEIKYSNASYTYRIQTEKGYVDELLEEVNGTFDLKVKHTGMTGLDYFVTSFKNTDTPDDWSYSYVFQVDGKNSDMGTSATPLKTDETYTFLFAAVSFGPAPDYAMIIESLGPCALDSGDQNGNNLPKTKLIFFIVSGAVLLTLIAAGVFITMRGNKNKNENE